MIKTIFKAASFIAVLGISTSVTADQWPVGLADKVTVHSKGASIRVLGNDIGSNLLVTEVNSWSKKGGRVSLGTLGSDSFRNSRGASTYVDYLPPANFTGDDTFWYVLTDDKGRTNAAKVTVTVKAEGTRFPDPSDDQVSVQKDTPIRINVLKNDIYINSIRESTISDFNKWSRQGGQIKIESAPAEPLQPQLVYTPREGFTGTDTFWYVIKSQTTSSSEQYVEHAAKVTVEVTNSNQAGPYPTAQEDSVIAEVVCNNRFCPLSLNQYYITSNDTGNNLKITANAYSLNGGKVNIVPEYSIGRPSIFYEASDLAKERGTDKIWYTIEDEVGRKNWGLINIKVRETF